MKYANHPGTIAIKDLNNTSLFSFSNVSVADVKKEIRKLDPRKATQNTDISVRILKQSSDSWAVIFAISLMNALIKVFFHLF